MVLGMSVLSNVYSSHHYEPSATTESQDAAADAADPCCQRQDTSEGMSTPSGQALGKWHGKMEIRVSCSGPSSTTRARSLEPASRSRGELVTDEVKHHSSWTMEGRTELDLVQDEADEAKRLLEEAHVVSKQPSSK